MDVGPESGGPEFPPFKRDQWAALAEKALRGASVEEALTSHTDDGIPVSAISERVVATPIATSHQSSRWTIVQRVDDPDVERARAQVRDDVEQGATGLALVFEGAPNAFGFGLPATPKALDTVLGDIPPGRVHLRIDAHPHSRTTAEMLVALLGRKRADMEKLSLSFGIDPAAIFAGTGGLRMSIEALQASMPQSLGHFFALGAPGILLEADGRVYHSAGATEAQELGVMIASAVLYLRMFSEARQPLVYAVPHIGFSLAVDQDQFLSMAKIRALRRLWTKVQESCGLEPTVAAVHAETSYRMMTARDPETNILRTTIAAFAAATGGADTISILPHTIAKGLPDGFARRIARNTQIVMADESHVGFVADPAAGSGAVEALTESLCGAAWKEFQAIEAEGGVLKSLTEGRIQKRVVQARQARAAAFGSDGRAIVGTTVFALKKERLAPTLSAKRRSVAVETAVTCEPLLPVRLDELVGAQP
ncbi:methylmalonyl-CoA mutase family protein [Arvimicrobium flavum]|uniref:methylmalonyl-CoA mutase family protein n=1 Tax=Arvimicrobium flavum TaxID=3393320 RepID=UPI00237B0B14|nr:methylmalonyl-CoA mutase family protein [Mesorhizobium shangrilense]